MNRNRNTGRFNRRRRRRSVRESVWGSLLLEILALAALLALLALHDGDEPTDELAANPITEFSSLASGYVADQFRQHPMLKLTR